MKKVAVFLSTKEMRDMKEHIKVSVNVLKGIHPTLKHLFSNDIKAGEKLIKVIESYEVQV